MKTVPIAKALILDSDNNVLILRRSQTHPTLPGRPDLPGGLIEEGEEQGKALCREIEEETGLHVSPNDLKLAYAGTEIYNGKNRVRFLYWAKLKAKTPEVVISWEHDRTEWLDLGELERLEMEFHAFYHDALHYVRINQLLPN